MNARDFHAINPREDDAIEAEKIREKNIDRLKALQFYQQNGGGTGSKVQSSSFVDVYGAGIDGSSFNIYSDAQRL